MEFKSSKTTYKVVEPLSAKEFSKVFKCNGNGVSDFCVLKVIPFLNVKQVQCAIEIQSKIHNQYFPPFIETFEDANSFKKKKKKSFLIMELITPDFY